MKDKTLQTYLMVLGKDYSVKHIKNGSFIIPITTKAKEYFANNFKKVFDKMVLVAKGEASL